jgi:hypothetical protein
VLTLNLRLRAGKASAWLKRLVTPRVVREAVSMREHAKALAVRLLEVEMERDGLAAAVAQRDEILAMVIDRCRERLAEAETRNQQLELRLNPPKLSPEEQERNVAQLVADVRRWSIELQLAQASGALDNATVEDFIR